MIAPMSPADIIGVEGNSPAVFTSADDDHSHDHDHDDHDAHDHEHDHNHFGDDSNENPDPTRSSGTYERISGMFVKTVESNYRFLTQRFKETIGAKDVRVTMNKEVEIAIKQIEELHEYFKTSERLVTRQLVNFKNLSDVESELSLFYLQNSHKEPSTQIKAQLSALGKAYHSMGPSRQVIVKSLETFLDSIKTFKDKAIADTLDTVRNYNYTRIEYDSLSTKLDAMAKNAYDRTQISTTEAHVQQVKARYESLCQAVMQKGALLQLKKEHDYQLQLERLLNAQRPVYGIEEVVCESKQPELPEVTLRPPVVISHSRSSSTHSQKAF